LLTSNSGCGGVEHGRCETEAQAGEQESNFEEHDCGVWGLKWKWLIFGVRSDEGG